MTIYCPLCNKSSDEIRFIGNFCEDCIIKKIEKKIPKNVTIYQCRWCNRIKVGNTFMELNNQSLGKAIKLELKLHDWVKARSHDSKKVHATIQSDVNDDRISFPFEFDLKIAHETCERCYHISSGYYEAIVQIRGTSFEKINRLAAKVKKYIEKNGGFVTKTEKVEGGVDVYTSDKLATNAFVSLNSLKVTRSYRLYGLKRGKRVYRNTYSIHV